MHKERRLASASLAALKEISFAIKMITGQRTLVRKPFLGVDFLSVLVENK